MQHSGTVMFVGYRSWAAALPVQATPRHHQNSWHKDALGWAHIPEICCKRSCSLFSSWPLLSASTFSLMNTCIWLFLSFSFLQVQSTGIFQPANCWTTQRFKRKRLGSLFHAPTLAWAVKVHLLQQMQHTKSLAKLYKRPQCSLQWGQDQDLHEF